MQITRDDIVRHIDSPEFSTEIIHILRRNNEAITENSNGFFFEFAKLNQSSLQQIANLVGKQNVQVESENTALDVSNHNAHLEADRLVHENPTNLNSDIQQNTSGSTIRISQKFINEYAMDVEKTAGKPLSILKFMNSKKKYMRNPETLLSKNEPVLKKEPYIIV